MKCVLLGLILAALSALPSFAAEIMVAPAEAKEHSLVRCSTETRGTGYAWFVTGQSGYVDIEVMENRCVFTAPPGRYQVLLVVALEGGKLETGHRDVTISAGQSPLGPSPTPAPMPVPVPTPMPTPTPEPTPAPAFTVGKLRVLVLYETGDIATYTRDQQKVLASTKLRAYLDSHCEKSMEGFSEWRMWDDDYAKEQIAPRHGDAWWTRYGQVKQASMGRLPWLTIYRNATPVASQPLTTNEEDTLKLLKTFGGE